MTVLNKTEDFQVNGPLGDNLSVYKIGSKTTISKNGTNQTNGLPLAPHPYVFSLVHENIGNVVGYLSDGRIFRFGILQSGAGPNPLYQVNNWSSNDDNKLLIKARERARGHQFDGGTVLAESHQSLSLIANSANKLARYADNLWRGDLSLAASALGCKKLHRRIVRNPKKYFSNIFDAHLAMQYGWIPLLVDVKSAAEAVSARLNKKAKTSFRVSRTSNGIMLNAPWNVGNWDYINLKRVNMIITATENTSWVNSFGLDDPLSALWNRKPYSFIVDWFYPIGDMLEARHAGSSMEVTNVITSTKTVKLTRLRSVSLERSNPTYIKTTYGQSFYKEISFNRSISTSLPSAQLPAIRPLTESLSVIHVLNAIALMGSAFLRPLRLSYWHNPLD